MFQAGVGIGQPKTCLSGRSTLAFPPASSRWLHLEREAGMDRQLLLGWQGALLTTPRSLQPRARMFRARPLGWAQRGRETPASRLLGAHLPSVLGQWVTNAVLAGDTVGEVSGQP